MLSDFLRREAEERIDSWSSSVDDQAFLSAFNEQLERFESELYREVGRCPPIVWVVAQPRSGSTLAVQMLASGLDVRYINNLMARFWRAPLTGIRLSRIVLGDVPCHSFESFYGKTLGAEGPHEFSYFWHQLLCMENIPPYDPVAAAKKIDWEHLRKTINNIVDSLGGVFVHKAVPVIYFLEKIAELFPDSIFLHVRRDLLDCACSTARVRMNYYGDLNHWWGMFTDSYETVKDAPYWEQIVHQVLYFHELECSGLSAVNPRRIVRCSYDQMCANPHDVLQAVRHALADWTGVEVALRGTVPAQQRSTSPVDDDVRARLAEEFARRGWDIARMGC